MDCLRLKGENAKLKEELEKEKTKNVKLQDELKQYIDEQNIDEEPEI